MKLFCITLDKDYDKTKLKELVLLYQKQTNKQTNTEENKTKQNKTKKKTKHNKQIKAIAKLKLIPLLRTQNSFQNQIDLQRSFTSVV